MFASYLVFMTNKMMDEHNNTLIDSAVLSWVYIIMNTKSLDLIIGFCFNPSKHFENHKKPEKLVYYRSFVNSFDAVAHKHLLESLSGKSVMHNIKQINPDLNNLMSEIKNL